MSQHLNSNSKLSGFEIITNDDIWYVVQVWDQGVCTTKLFPKDEVDFQGVLDWLSFRKIVEG